jgi:hypothetical protein
MKTVIDWFREHEGWRRERCAGCGGHGVISDYGRGEDFYGAKECSCCAGTGVQWRTPPGRYRNDFNGLRTRRALPPWLSGAISMLRFLRKCS